MGFCSNLQVSRFVQFLLFESINYHIITMKLSVVALTGLFAAVTTALPQAFTLVADGGKTVLTDGGMSWLICDNSI